MPQKIRRAGRRGRGRPDRVSARGSARGTCASPQACRRMVRGNVRGAADGQGPAGQPRNACAVF